MGLPDQLANDGVCRAQVQRQERAARPESIGVGDRLQEPLGEIGIVHQTDEPEVIEDDIERRAEVLLRRLQDRHRIVRDPDLIGGGGASLEKIRHLLDVVADERDGAPDLRLSRTHSALCRRPAQHLCGASRELLVGDGLSDLLTESLRLHVSLVVCDL